MIDNFLYIANRNGADGFKIMKLDTNLNYISSFGNQSPSTDSITGNFYGPKRFLAILNKKLTILDEGSTNESSGFQGDRLITITDITGSGWETYGQAGAGIGQFEFYWAC